jgi:hypothetical protein
MPLTVGLLAAWTRVRGTMWTQQGLVIVLHAQQGIRVPGSTLFTPSYAKRVHTRALWLHPAQMQIPDTTSLQQALALRRRVQRALISLMRGNLAALPLPLASMLPLLPAQVLRFVRLGTSAQGQA